MAAPGEKIKMLRAFIAAEDWPAALRLANSFPRLPGELEAAIRRAHEVTLRPEPYKEMGYDIEATIAAGIAALKEHYGG